MKVQVNRKKEQTNCCVGDLYVDGVFVCNTLEPSVTKKNDRGIQGIPDDTYQMILFDSPKFNIQLPLITKDITTGIDESQHRYEIHWGNSHVDTDDCILLGTYEHEDWISHSKIAWKNFMDNYFMEAINSEESITLEINNQF